LDQSKRLGEIEKELLNLAEKERKLLQEQKKLRCKQTYACSVMDIINSVQIG
jgi:hypothetical protein